MMQLIFHEPSFSFQLLRIIGQTYYGGADIGECLSTAYRIRNGDIESWYIEWLRTADRVYKYAQDCISKGHKDSAREAYLRATNYYQNGAAFYLDTNPSDPRILPTWEKGVESFRRASQLFSSLVEMIEIPYNGTTLPGYFFNANNGEKYNKNQTRVARPTLILATGLDGGQEELYFLGVASALSRGYNCLTFEGPGQGMVVRKQKLPFRPDWEKVVSPVIDFILSTKKEEVDSQRIALIGYSMGGYLAPRAAAFEDRIAACIADDGVLSIYDAWINQQQSIREDIENRNAAVVNAVIYTIMNFDIGTKWKITHSMSVFGARSPLELIEKVSKYSMHNIADKIKCPTLLLAGEKDHSFAGQAQRLYDLLKCPKKYILFTEEEGAEDHCHVGALSLANQRILDWLDETLAK
ncbi:MAG: alpha/beta fold hydrolase [Thermoproteota archaeon]|nr:alpha/beta fold hydrolase [Thermoproteota archaeon]